MNLAGVALTGISSKSQAADTTTSGLSIPLHYHPVAIDSVERYTQGALAFPGFLLSGVVREGL